MDKYRINTLYGIKVIKPEIKMQLTVIEPNKWLVLLEELKLFGMYFMMFFCWFVVMFALSGFYS